MRNWIDFMTTTTLRRQDEKIDNVAALIDAWVAYSRNRDIFD